VREHQSLNGESLNRVAIVIP